MAGDFQVTCIVKRDRFNPHERIEKLGYQGSWMLTEDVMISRIENGTESFYTLVNGYRADIVVAVHQGRKYLKTRPDGYSPDNLLSLDDCVNCKLLA